MIRLSNLSSLFIFFLLCPSYTVAQAAPANDAFSYSTTLLGPTGTVNESNVDATAEIGEPNHGGDAQSPHASLWFSWLADASELIFFDTFGSDFDTTIAAYKGSAVNSLTQVAVNDDFGSMEQSRIQLTAIAGTTYHIAVDGYSDTAVGNVVLQWLPAPENDNFSNATVLTGSRGTVTGSNTTATTEAGEPDLGGDLEGPFASIWYSWTAENSGRTFFDTFGSDFDTTIVAYTGSVVNNLTQVAVNDDYAGSIQSKVVFSATAGTTYYIAVDSFEEHDEIGNVVLNYRQVQSFFPAIFHLLLGSP